MELYPCGPDRANLFFSKLRSYSSSEMKQPPGHIFPSCPLFVAGYFCETAFGANRRRVIGNTRYMAYSKML